MKENILKVRKILLLAGVGCLTFTSLTACKNTKEKTVESQTVEVTDVNQCILNGKKILIPCVASELENAGLNFGEFLEKFKLGPSVTMKENEMENNPDVMVDIYNSSPEESVSTLDSEIQTLSIHNSENTQTATFIDNITFENTKEEILEKVKMMDRMFEEIENGVRVYDDEEKTYIDFMFDGEKLIDVKISGKM